MNSTLKRALAFAATVAQMHKHLDAARGGRHPVREAAERMGWSLLGSGAYSDVFAESDNGYVVKVGYDAACDSALTYLAWCRANQGMRHVPNIHHLQRWSSGCFIAVLDRMETVDSNEPDFQVAESIMYRGSVKDDKGYTSVVNTVLAIREFFDGVASKDLHSGNCMRNEHGELVITDPIASVNSRDLKNGIERAYGVSKAAA